MDFTDADMRTMTTQGDAVGFVRMYGGLRGNLRRDPAESISCQHCKVPSNTRCTTKRGRTLTAGIHQIRIDDYNQTTQPARPPGAWPTTRKENPWTAV